MKVEEQFESVLRAAQAGAEWAIARLYREFHPKLLRYLRGQRAPEAEDVASEVWVDVATALNRFVGDEAAFRRWFFTIARRRLIDRRRREARRRTDPLPVESLPETGAPDDPEATALDAAATDAALSRIAALPADQAEVVLLRVLAGLDVNDVAAITGKRPGTVRVLQHRALRQLAKQMFSVLVTL